MSRHTRGKGLLQPRVRRSDSKGAVGITRQDALDRASPERGKDSNIRENSTPQVELPRRLTPEQEFQLIQMRAYYLWQQAGCPPGDAARDQFWIRAEREVATR
jgi:hypothetical protein